MRLGDAAEQSERRDSQRDVASVVIPATRTGVVVIPATVIITIIAVIVTLWLRLVVLRDLIRAVGAIVAPRPVPVRLIVIRSIRAHLPAVEAASLGLFLSSFSLLSVFLPAFVPLDLDGIDFALGPVAKGLNFDALLLRLVPG